MGKRFILFVTGASGVGKTTLINNLEKKHSGDVTYQFEHFDSIGVPSVAEMNEHFGSGEKWQEAMTHAWVEKLTKNPEDKEVVILEGQMNVQFIKDAFERQGFTSYGIILIDGNDKEVFARLIEKRLQPELANQEMQNWLLFLRKQATELAIPIIDTTDKNEEKVLQEFEQTLSKLLLLE